MPDNCLFCKIVRGEIPASKLYEDEDIVAFRDGTSALDYLLGADQSGRVSMGRSYLVLLDLNLPRMSGIEFLKALRADPTLRDLRVIVLTSSNEPNDRAAAFRYEVEDYIVKPHSFEQFTTAIQTVIDDLFSLSLTTE